MASNSGSSLNGAVRQRSDHEECSVEEGDALLQRACANVHGIAKALAGVSAASAARVAAAPDVPVQHEAGSEHGLQPTAATAAVANGASRLFIAARAAACGNAAVLHTATHTTVGCKGTSIFHAAGGCNGGAGALCSSSGDLTSSSGDLTMSSQDLTMSSRDLTMSSRDLTVSSRDLTTSSADLTCSSGTLTRSSSGSMSCGSYVDPEHCVAATAARGAASSSSDASSSVSCNSSMSCNTSTSTGSPTDSPPSTPTATASPSSAASTPDRPPRSPCPPAEALAAIATTTTTLHLTTPPPTSNRHPSTATLAPRPAIGRPAVPGSQPTPTPTTFLDLPAIAIHAIATATSRAPLSTLSRAVAAACPPPTALRPDDLLTPADLTAALASLARRHASSLTTLDLRHVARLLGPHSLPFLCPAALPRLASLTLHRPPPGLTHAVVLAAAALPLRSLDLRPTPGCTPAALSHVLTHLPTLCSLTLSVSPASLTPASATTFRQVSTLRHLTHLRLTTPAATSPPPGSTPTVMALLAATATLRHLQHLSLGAGLSLPFHRAIAALLSRHTSLTTLSIATHHDAPSVPANAHPLPGPHPPPVPHNPLGPFGAAAARAGTDSTIAVLEAIGSLGPRLRHLGLTLPDGTCPVAVDSCLAHLPLLQSLDIVSEKAPSLPVLAVHCGGLTGLRRTAPAHIDRYTEPQLLAIMSLGTQLRVLDMQQDSLQIECLNIVTSMSRLTELKLASVTPVRLPCGALMPMLCALPMLRVLHLQGSVGHFALADPWRVGLPALTGLTSLAVVDCGVHDATLADGLVAGMRGLEVLDLRHNSGVKGAGLRALAPLPRLREVVLSLPRGMRGTGPLPHLLLPPPPALCRVFVSSAEAGVAPFDCAETAAAVEKLLAPCCEVVYGCRAHWQ